MNNIDERIIELRELRIGNLLEYKGDLVQVTSLSCDIDDEYEDQICFVKIGASSNEKGGWNRSLVNDLKRIPLTAELLERCGFIKHEDDGKWEHDDYLEWPGLLYLPHYDLKYLHQLQNLYWSLTGEELTIKEKTA